MPLDKMSKSIDSKSDFEVVNGRGNESTSGRDSSGADTSPSDREFDQKVLFYTQKGPRKQRTKYLTEVGNLAYITLVN